MIGNLGIRTWYTCNLPVWQLKKWNNPSIWNTIPVKNHFSQYVINSLHMAKYMRPVWQLMALQKQYGQQQCLSLDICEMLKLNFDGNGQFYTVIQCDMLWYKYTYTHTSINIRTTDNLFIT